MKYFCSVTHLSAQKITVEVYVSENHKEVILHPPEYILHPIWQTFWSAYWIQSGVPATEPQGLPSPRDPQAWTNHPNEAE